MKIKKSLVGLATFITMCILSTTLSIPAFAENPSRSYGPSLEYKNVQNLPKNVKYNSAGVPILGKDIEPNNLISPYYSDISGEYAINGHTIPLYNYPINSIWDGSNECVGFARYVYNTLWNNKSGTTFTASIPSKDVAERKLKSLKNGTRITGFKDNKQMHTMITVSTSVYTDGIIVYHANYSTKYNKVTLTKFTYDEFATLFDYIEGVNPPT
ncbi:MAG: hypothetical protein E7476_09950 [Ruminococcaceae bacterium]|jgi:hypothetical protein|nr:hypothetical protein [Oscillospiraceae bacterium]